MSHEITLEQAAEKALQAEVIALLLEEHPSQLIDSQVSAVVTMLRRLNGEVYCWLVEEQAQRQGK